MGTKQNSWGKREEQPHTSSIHTAYKKELQNESGQKKQHTHTHTYASSPNGIEEKRENISAF